MDAAAQPEQSERMNVAVLLNRVRQWPKTFWAILLLVIAAFAAYAVIATPQYRAVVKLMPREPDSPAGGLSSVLGGSLGGLAAIAGLNLGSVNEQEAIALLKSRALFTQFVEEQKLMPVLFDKKWDPANQRWRTDSEHTPTAEDAWTLFDKSIRRVADDPKTQLITLDVTWKDRQLAAAWANELVRLANEELRQRALHESAASISSFQEQLTRTDAVELRQAIYKLMENQVNRSAVAKSRLDYALTVIDPAMAPDAKRFVSPRRALALVIALPLALFMAICVVLAAGVAERTLAEMRRLR